MKRLKNKLIATKGERKGRDTLGVCDEHIALLYTKQITSKDLLIAQGTQLRVCVTNNL